MSQWPDLVGGEGGFGVRVLGLDLEDLGVHICVLGDVGVVLPLLELRGVVVLVGDDDPELVLGGVGTTVLEDAGGSAVLSFDRDSVNAFLLPESKKNG